MSHGTYSSHRTWDELHKSGVPCSEKRVPRLMKDTGIFGVVRCEHRQTPLDTHGASYPENLLARNFKAEAVIAASPSCPKNWGESVFADLKITNEVKTRKTVIAFTAQKAGKFSFTCSIGRYEGSITVK